MRVITPSSPIFNAPDLASGRETEALFGEDITIRSHHKGWAEITLNTDGYRGWIAASSLGELPLPSHHIIVPRTLMTISPDVKSPLCHHLPLGALISAKPAKDDGVLVVHGETKSLGYIPKHHALPLGEYVDDYVKIAESLMHTPYLFGGRDSMGFDCSALVQLSLGAWGVKVMRNSGDQQKEIGSTLTDMSLLQRGDLVFWKGHVGIMTDAETLLHANAHHHMVATEPLETTIKRFDNGGVGPITRLARP